ncbi:MAG: SpoIVB peptidase S55 domain-containing protein, partial [Ruminococcus sp.]
MFKRIRTAAVLISAAVLSTFAAAEYYSKTLPDSYYIASDSELELSSLVPITAKLTEEDSLAAFYQNSSRSGCASLKLFGIVPIKTADIQEIETPMLIPGGEPFGIRLRMDGVMVIRLGAADTKNGTVCPAKDAGLCAGDIINSVDGIKITSNDSLKSAICAAEGKPVTVNFTREDDELSCTLTPAYSLSEGCYTAGIWVRDSLAGIGTMTFYDPKNMTFGGLGHPICDSDTGVCIPIGEGSACPIAVSGIEKGMSGDPGMLEGSFRNEKDLGDL